MAMNPETFHSPTMLPNTPAMIQLATIREKDESRAPLRIYGFENPQLVKKINEGPFLEKYIPRIYSKKTYDRHDISFLAASQDVRHIYVGYRKGTFALIHIDSLEPHSEYEYPASTSLATKVTKIVTKNPKEFYVICNNYITEYTCFKKEFNFRHHAINQIVDMFRVKDDIVVVDRKGLVYNLEVNESMQARRKETDGIHRDYKLKHLCGTRSIDQIFRLETNRPEEFLCLIFGEQKISLIDFWNCMDGSCSLYAERLNPLRTNRHSQIRVVVASEYFFYAAISTINGRSDNKIHYSLLRHIGLPTEDPCITLASGSLLRLMATNSLIMAITCANVVEIYDAESKRKDMLYRLHFDEIITNATFYKDALLFSSAKGCFITRRIPKKDQICYHCEAKLKRSVTGFVVCKHFIPRLSSTNDEERWFNHF
jgi:hypothetical protein